MWIKDRFFKYTAGILLTLLIIYYLGKIEFILGPIKKFVLILFAPLLIAGFFYYLLRPLVRVAVRYHIPRGLAILGSFLVVIGIFAAIGTYAGSLLWKQLSQLMSDLPHISQVLTQKTLKFIKDNNLESLINEKVQQQLVSNIQNLVPFFQSRIPGAITGVTNALTNAMTITLTIPFILYYMLKDDNRFSKNIIKFVPEKYKDDIMGILEETDRTLSDYITGKAIIAIILGVMMFIGYVVIGLKYTFILALFVVFASFIPMFGALIGVIPAVFVGLAMSPFMAVKVLIIMVIVQQLEGNLISPLFIGKRMAIHPLTLILLFLTAAGLFGFIGMLVAVPVYAVMKILAKGAYKVYLLKSGKVNLSSESIK